MNVGGREPKKIVSDTFFDRQRSEPGKPRVEKGV